MDSSSRGFRCTKPLTCIVNNSKSGLNFVISIRRCSLSSPPPLPFHSQVRVQARSEKPMPASKKFIDINVGLLMPPHAFPPKQISQERTEDLLHKKPKPKKKKKTRDQTLGSRIQLRCTAIQKFLLDQTTGSERSIRETFGDNPDTSKALRMLVKQHRVKRFGCGGKANPFVYMALIPPNMSELERLEEANAVGMI